jgi:predicted PurR-regulated permease PerM
MNDRNHVEVTVSNRTVIRVIALIVLTLLAFRFLSNVGNVLQLLFIAFFLALALNPAVGWIARKLKLKSRAAATGIAYLAVVAVLSLFISYVVPPLVRQTVDFVSNVPHTVESLKSEDSPAGRFIQRYNLQAQVEGLSENLQSRTRHFQQPIITTAGRVGSALISLITVLVLTFMMLVEGPAWLDRYWALQPARRRDHHKKLAHQMYRVVTGYVNGQLILSLIAASFAFVTLVIASTLLNETINAVALAGILIFTGLIPMIGNTIGGVIVVLASLFVSFPLAIVMAVFFVLYQQIENISLQPYIQSKYNELRPLLVFSAALLGIGFGGLLGGLIAIPLAGCLKILFLDYLERRNRGLSE